MVDNVATVPVLHGQSRSAQPAGPRSRCSNGSGWIAIWPTRYPAQLSGGQQQRVGVARALAADPPILLMDEPFSAVDPVVRADLQTEMQRLQAELHKTIVFVTHDIDEAVKLGDQIAVFGRGGVLQQYDTPADGARRARNGFRRGIRRTRSRLSRAVVPLAPTAVALHDRSATTDRTSSPHLRLDQGEWVLVVDASRRTAAAGSTSPAWSGSAPATPWTRAHCGGRFAVPRGGDLRQALDAAISSPSGIGVAVDEAGAVRRRLLAAEVLILELAEQRQAEDARTQSASPSPTGTTP